jgi:hypothetical protein
MLCCPLILTIKNQNQYQWWQVTWRLSCLIMLHFYYTWFFPLSAAITMKNKKCSLLVLWLCWWAKYDKWCGILAYTSQICTWASACHKQHQSSVYLTSPSLLKEYGLLWKSYFGGLYYCFFCLIDRAPIYVNIYIYYLPLHD